MIREQKTRSGHKASLGNTLSKPREAQGYALAVKAVIISDMKRTGRPTSYRPEHCERIVTLMAEGRSLDGCASILGVHPDSLYEWQKKLPEFSDAVRAGRAAATTFWEERLLEVAKGGSGNAQAIQWALRNRSRAASGWDHAHAKLEVSGPDGGAVQVQTEVTVIDSRLLTPDQREAFKQALLAARAFGEPGGEHNRTATARRDHHLRLTSAFGR